ncbi:MAG: ABC transporter ATP-binding protein [Proteobacteria bacterium]|nr:ABC transporter ATP-binding protein [Pseudomonadota bacterium]MBU1452582.1 ABC transporter ATP-binding protein [Pseudomonadota bacterium]MBU2469231.1 ABC transporter ATP-binding protein [Pseudomonadota bacterium]MBU2517025.1 ABC transporter ATP-binding protein [Pseudomonadota bacterium]
MSSPLLRVENLNKAFGKVVTARDLNFTVEAGVLTSIIGPNGAGKSTLINVLSGLLPADSGHVYFQGEEITHLPTHRRVRLGLCRSFQVVNVFPHLTVFENVEIPVLAQMRKAAHLFRPVAREKAVGQRVMEVLERTNLAGQANGTASALSHGDQRLLEVGIALAAKPSLLFLDEPTAGMNPVERVDILRHIRRLSASGETTFVIVEHDMDIVFSLSDRVMVLNRGDIICDGGPDHVKGDRQVRECYLGEEVVA